MKLYTCKLWSEQPAHAKEVSFDLDKISVMRWHPDSQTVTLYLLGYEDRVTLPITEAQLIRTMLEGNS